MDLDMYSINIRIRITRQIHVPPLTNRIRYYPNFTIVRWKRFQIFTDNEQEFGEQIYMIDFNLNTSLQVSNSFLLEPYSPFLTSPTWFSTFSTCQNSCFLVNPASKLPPLHLTSSFMKNTTSCYKRKYNIDKYHILFSYKPITIVKV